MKFTKPDLHLLVLCISALVLLAAGGARVFHSSNDFVPVYTGARCLLHGCNPYDPSQLEQQFYQAGGRDGELPSWDIDVPVYPPSTFLVLSPLALLPFPAARLLWFVLSGCLLVTAAGLILSVSPPPHRWLATVLVSFFLITAGILLVLGQPAVFAISLVVIGSCLFLRDRLLPLVRPCCFCSASGRQAANRRPDRTLFAIQENPLALRGRRHGRRGCASSLRMPDAQPSSAECRPGLPLFARICLPRWGPGGSADPRPENQQAIGDLNLQTLTSIFFPDAGMFNPVAYVTFLARLLRLDFGSRAVRSRSANESCNFLALGALSILSLMPVYHRFYDTRLLLLSIPAVLIVFQKHRLLGTLIASLTVLAGISVQYRVQTYILQHSQWQDVLAHKVLFILLLRQQNLELLILFSLYLFAISSIRFSSTTKIGSYPVHESAIPLHAK